MGPCEMAVAVSTCLHASCVAIDGRGVLLVGSSGVGKSDVALRLIDGGAELVSDDQTLLRAVGEALIASPPEALAGMIELREVGLMHLSSWSEAQVALYVELVGAGEPIERLPEPMVQEILGVSVRKIRLLGCAASTPAKIRAALTGVFEDV